VIRPREDLTGAAAAADAPATAGGDVLDRLPPDLEYFRTSEAYRVDLAAFQGPLDLLLYLIQKDEIDIYDIPVGQITEQYLRYLAVIQALDLDTAGDFIVMAATLMRIKARLLLPVQTAEAMEEEDPRAELVRRLLEYKRFKEAAAALRRHEEERSRWHVRQARWPFLDEAELPPPQLRLNMYELLSALAVVFDRLQTAPVHTVQREPFTVEQKMARIRDHLLADPLVRFDTLFAGDAIKMEVVVTFIALLELCKRGEVGFVQTQANGPIWIRPVAATLKAAAAAAGGTESVS
jgi:segregation and condensation protein A